MRSEPSGKGAGQHTEMTAQRGLSRRRRKGRGWLVSMLPPDGKLRLKVKNHELTPGSGLGAQRQQTGWPGVWGCGCRLTLGPWAGETQGQPACHSFLPCDFPHMVPQWFMGLRKGHPSSVNLHRHCPSHLEGCGARSRNPWPRDTPSLHGAALGAGRVKPEVPRLARVASGPHAPLLHLQE